MSDVETMDVDPKPDETEVIDLTEDRYFEKWALNNSSMIFMSSKIFFI